MRRWSRPRCLWPVSERIRRPASASRHVRPDDRQELPEEGLDDAEDLEDRRGRQVRQAEGAIPEGEVPEGRAAQVRRGHPGARDARVRPVRPGARDEWVRPACEQRMGGPDAVPVVRVGPDAGHRGRAVSSGPDAKRGQRDAGVAERRTDRAVAGLREVGVQEAGSGSLMGKAAGPMSEAGRPVRTRTRESSCVPTARVTARPGSRRRRRRPGVMSRDVRSPVETVASGPTCWCRPQKGRHRGRFPRGSLLQSTFAAATCEHQSAIGVAGGETTSCTRGTVGETGGASVRVRRRTTTAPATAVTTAARTIATYLFGMVTSVPFLECRCRSGS